MMEKYSQVVILVSNRKNIISYILIGVIISIFIAAFIYLYNNREKEFVTEYYQELKDYKANEYIPVYMSDNDMAKIYLNDFITLAYNEPEKSYHMLNEKYREIKYPTYELYYNNFVINLNYPTIKEFYKKNISGSLIFGIYDTEGNIYVFETNGVMQYSVYLDDYTVEIGD